jgi:hypothetical protein
MADQKTLGALLSGIARREFHGDAEMTNDFLAEQLFGGDTAGAFVYVQSITRPSIDRCFNWWHCGSEGHLIFSRPVSVRSLRRRSHHPRARLLKTPCCVVVFSIDGVLSTRVS